MTELKFNISKALVLLTNGTDEVTLYTTLPSPYSIEITDEPLKISFKTPGGSGVDYVRDNFNMEPEVIDVRGIVKSVAGNLHSE
ncbi:hypothetical protein LCGC14_0879230 [marine sediment metagenome]|uniref:Uncharacterized protein n=1 Tax=marine sediment metagenome TaxID=412755 RepID=A0A0F9P2F0_9ZZZZ